MIYEVCRITEYKNIGSAQNIYIYIYAYICVKLLSEFTKGVGLVVCMSLQNDVFLPKESHHPWAHERKMTPTTIRSSKSENSQPRIALPMVHLSLACSSIDQVFTKWIIKWITDPLKQPQQTTPPKKKTLKVASRWSFLDLGFFLASRIQTARFCGEWFHGSMGFHGETVSPRCLTWLLGAPTGPLT